MTDTDFLTAQNITAVSTPTDSRIRVYALTGLLICGICQRRLDGHWVYGKPGYRCRHGHISVLPTGR